MQVPLLLVVAALGVDAGWDHTADGQLIYTIQIEPELVDVMKNGQAVTGSVPPSVRDLRFFRISVGAPAGRGGTTAPTVRRASARPETQVDFGWRPTDQGAMEYLIQIRPERLKSLQEGIPIEGEIDPQAGDIRGFYVFVGVGDLPRERPGTKTADLRPLDRNIESNASAIGQDRFGQDRLASNSNYSSGSRSSETSGGFRDESQPAIRRNSGGLDDRAPAFSRNERPDNGLPQDGLLTPPLGSNRRTAPTNYDDYTNNYSQPSRNPNERTSGYGPDPGAAPPTDYGNARAPAPTYARTDTSGAQAPSAWQSPSPTGLPTSGFPATTAAAAFPGTSAPAAEAPVKPWAPLIMTTLGLFVSIAANTYLGWLAWTFFWRYREAVSELARSRSDVLGVRASG